jgi:hypothetical protein
MTSHDAMSKKAKTIKGKSKMRKLNITFTTILLALGCFALSPAAKADQPIVGLWHVYFTNNIRPPFETYKQWHSDGLEFESPSFSLGQCMGTWIQTARRTVHLFHIGWTPGGIPPAPTSVRFEETEVNTISLDRNSYGGTYDQKFFDANGNVVFEDMGTLHATRISVNESNTTASK